MYRQNAWPGLSCFYTFRIRIFSNMTHNMLQVWCNIVGMSCFKGWLKSSSVFNSEPFRYTWITIGLLQGSLIGPMCAIASSMLVNDRWWSKGEVCIRLKIKHVLQRLHNPFIAQVLNWGSLLYIWPGQAHFCIFQHHAFMVQQIKYWTYTMWLSTLETIKINKVVHGYLILVFAL